MLTMLNTSTTKFKIGPSNALRRVFRRTGTPVRVPLTVLRMGQTVELRGRLATTLHGRTVLMTGPTKPSRFGKVRLKTPGELVTPWASVTTFPKKVVQFSLTATPGIPTDPGGQFPLDVQHILPVTKPVVFRGNWP